MTLLRNLSVAGAIRNLFSALLNGTALFPYDMKKMGLAGLAELLIREQITVFHSSASLFRSFVQQLTGSEQFPKLRLIRLGSEPVMWTDVELFNKHFSPQCTLVNALSSTEARTYLQYFVDTQSEIRAGVLPVGFPVDDTEVLIFDDNDRPLPPGETGEMVLRTPCVFPGYWKHDTDVRKEIVTDPERMGGLLLRTGDLGYRRPDGCLVHVGRKDFQTKIRGHRVELAEVETALLDIAGIKHAVVLALEDGSGGARLTAYVVPYDGQILTASRLRASLQEKLPAYVIPASFVILDSLPLTASGKVDRRALPPPDRSRHQLDGPYAAPKNPIEKVLVNLWAEVLGVAEIGVHDDFIELGGDSLLGARIVARVNESFSPKNPLKILFETPTVAKLCAFLREQESSPGQAEKDAEILLQAERPSVDAMRHSFEK
jgi:acyl-coenzyme A synthetase/AMP-(fatty) acid ligase